MTPTVKKQSQLYRGPQDMKVQPAFLHSTVPIAAHLLGTERQDEGVLWRLLVSLHWNKTVICRIANTSGNHRAA